MSDEVCATPTTFDLKVRVVSPLLDPFKSHDYTLSWGSDTRTGTLDGNGALVEKGLDGGAKSGILTLRDENATPVIVIPLQAHTASDCQPAQSPDPPDDEKKLYDVGWRLCNLGMVGHVMRVAYDDVYPLTATQLKNAKEALRRYQFAHGFITNNPGVQRVPDPDFYGNDPQASDDVVSDIKKVHDGA